ncbi:MAG: glycosyltransferase family 39 protein [Solirubrobacteraceae bacterium]
MVDQRVVWIALVGLTLLAAAVRLPFLGHQSLWLDEIITRDIIREPSLTGVWNHVRATESTPPLFYVLEWLAGARSPVAMRLIPASALIAAVPVAYLAFRRLIGEWAAVAAAAVVAVTPALVEYSLDARAYGLLVLTGLLSVWGFGCLLERPSARRYGAWAVASAACVWSHYFGFFLVAGEAIVLFAALPRSRRSTLAWSLVIAALVAPLLPLVLHQSGDERAEFITGIPLGTRLTSTVRQFAMGANIPRTWLEGAGLALAISGLAAGVVIAIRSGSRSRWLLALLAIAFALPFALAVLRIEDRFYDRNVLFLLPLVAALAAPGLMRLRGVPLAAYLALAVVTSVWVATNWRYEQADWRTAVERMKAVDRSAAAVVVPRSQLSLVVASSYLGGPAKVTTTVARRAWIVVEPYRAAHRRALGPAPLPSTIDAVTAGFRTMRTIFVHGFRLVLVTAIRPTPINPARARGTAVFGPPL